MRETAQRVRSKATVKTLFLKPIQISIVLFDYNGNNNLKDRKKKKGNRGELKREISVHNSKVNNHLGDSSGFIQSIHFKKLRSQYRLSSIPKPRF